MNRLTTAVFAMGLVACGPTTDDDDDDDDTTETDAPPPEPTVVVGTGETAFVPLADGDEIDVVYGPQGGYHVYGSLQAWAIDPGDPEDLGSDRNPTVLFEARVDGDLLAQVQFVQGLDPTDDPLVFEMVGRLVILSITDDDDIEGQELELAVNLLDADGVSVSDRRTLVAVKDPRND